MEAEEGIEKQNGGRRRKRKTEWRQEKELKNRMEAGVGIEKQNEGYKEKEFKNRMEAEEGI